MLGYRDLLTVLLSVVCYHHTLAAETAPKEEIRMPGIKPATEDYYVCTSKPVTEEKYITQYEAIADAGTAHHILLFGCKKPFKDTATWECGSTCKGQSSIMFAWAKNADPTTLPKDVGYHIGGNSGVDYIVMQVHYARALTEEDPPDNSGIAIYTSKTVPKYTQGIMLMVSGYGAIPPHQATASLDISCQYDGSNVIHPFAYRTHAHALSTVISAYKKPGDESGANWEMLGKGNPQWPQAFYPMGKPHTISSGDILVARCVYNTTQKKEKTFIGEKHTDEMCNFYMMYYMEGEAEFLQCAGNVLPQEALSMPADSLVKLPPNPLLDDKASGHAHHHHVDKAPHDEALMAEVENWWTNPANINVGQISGLDTDNKGNLVIFHRGSHVWDSGSFDQGNNYLKENEGPITEKALVQFNASGHMVDSWGDNLFYLPHGITIDHEDNIWLTDVGLHQVFKFTAGEKKTASLTLGKRFKSGSDEQSFCKPTDVAVKSDGSFYVSDGYCNGRILYYDNQGHVVRTWGSQSVRSPAHSKFYVIHSLALSEPLNLLCAADREHARIQCFDVDGNYRYQYKHDQPVFAVAFKPNTEKLIAVEADQVKNTGGLFLLHMSPESADLVGHFTPVSKKFSVLHDVAVSKDGAASYVAELGPPSDVYRFNLEDDVAVVVDPQAFKTPDVKTPDVKTPAGSEHKPKVSSDNHVSVNNGEDTSQRVPILVAVLLIVPVLCVLIVLIGYKIYSNNRRGKGLHGKFDMGNIFGGSGRQARGDMAGFSPLTAQEDHYTDSEDEAMGDKRNFIKQ